MKLFVWLIFIVLVVLAIRKKAKPLTASTPDEVRTGQQESVAENMVSCAHCHIYLPASEAVHRGADVYCSAAHADLH
ncbi:PP0621 family protein [Undibacterium sp. Dicai25W]|uniref:PP0621 family protein n=1 Tax=Undibacterium sp. Dicai25W TaxID=3413034 RepID=UPI003BF03E08